MQGTPDLIESIVHVVRDYLTNVFMAEAVSVVVVAEMVARVLAEAPTGSTSSTST